MIEVPTALAYAFPLVLLLAGLAVGALAGWSLRSGHEVIETSTWRAEHKRSWNGTEEWLLEYDRTAPEVTR